MTPEQLLVLSTLLGALILFVDGRVRYDLVAVGALLLLTAANIIPAEAAFTGFGHPAVITVAAILIVSQGLLNSGLVEVLTRRLLVVGDATVVQVAMLTTLTTGLSAFMNNVGALALLLPVTLKIAQRVRQPASVFLMPIAFGSLLGGLVTLIGTPPNIIIAAFRADVSGQPFTMFDFAPVGVGVALAGVGLIALVGWRWIPRRVPVSGWRDGATNHYLTELYVDSQSDLVGKTAREIKVIAGADATCVALYRDNGVHLTPDDATSVAAADVWVVRVTTDALQNLVELGGMRLLGRAILNDVTLDDPRMMRAGDVTTMVVMVSVNSVMLGRSVRDLNLRWRYGINLLGVDRRGEALAGRLNTIRFEVGDVLLIEGAADTLAGTANVLGLLPSGDLSPMLGRPPRLLRAGVIFGGAVVLTALGVLPVQIAFTLAALLMVLVRLVAVEAIYQAVDWPVIVLLGAMIPVAGALETTGALSVISTASLSLVGDGLPGLVVVSGLLTLTMLLSNVVNNNAAALVMAPIAITLARGFGIPADALLMAVAVGATCAFVTPIGHQSNTLVMGPGGYLFRDYWRLGLPLSVLVIVVASPLIMVVWG